MNIEHLYDVNEFLVRFQHSSIKVGISKTQVCQSGVITVCNNGFSISVEKQFHRPSFCNMQKNSAEWRQGDKHECFMLNACLVEDNSPCKRAEETHISFLNPLRQVWNVSECCDTKKKTHNHQCKKPFVHIPRPGTALKFKEKGVSS